MVSLSMTSMAPRGIGSAMLTPKSGNQEKEARYKTYTSQSAVVTVGPFRSTRGQEACGALIRQAFVTARLGFCLGAQTGTTGPACVGRGSGRLTGMRLSRNRVNITLNTKGNKCL
jgi:hypothetical protein